MYCKPLERKGVFHMSYEIWFDGSDNQTQDINNFNHYVML